jgi:cell filamentation protein
MVLENILQITDERELARAEEKISKMRARQLFETDAINRIEVGTYAGLAEIHHYLFQDIYFFAGKMREVNIAKGSFRFAPLMYLRQSLEYIDRMPHNDFNEIIEKYVEMNVAHPFREGNGRAARIWLDIMLKAGIQKVVDWSLVEKHEYLSAMERSVVKDLEIRHLLSASLTDKIDDRDIWMKGIDASYFYEGYSEFRTQDL